MTAAVVPTVVGPPAQAPTRRVPVRHRLARRFPITTFMVIAFALSWWPALGRIDNPEAALVIPIGPSIAGLLVAGWRDGAGARRALRRSTVALRGRHGWRALWFVAAAAAGGIATALVGGAAVPTSASVGSSLLLLALIPMTAVLNGPLGEELGWRGFLLPHLLARRSPVAATAIVFPLWVLFHLPLVLTAPDRFGGWWLVTVAGLSVSLTWLHLRSGGSVGLAVVFHATVNSAGGASIQLFEEADRQLAWMGWASVWAVVGAVLLAGPLRRASAGGPVAPARPAAAATRGARPDRGAVASFLVVVAALAGTAQVAMLASGRLLEDQAGWVLLMMAAPGLAAVAVGRARREALPAGTFRLGGRAARPWYAVAWLLPLVVGAVAYGAAWATGWAPLEPGTSASAVVGSLVVALTLALPFSALTAFGEELGWRGFLLPRLVDAGVSHPVAVTSGLWWLFHVSLVLGGLYAAGPVPARGAVVFGVAVAAVGSVAGWSRLATGSVWPAVLLHASWNAVIQGAFDVHTLGEGPRAAAGLWVGESGVLVALAAVAAAVVVAAMLRSGRPRSTTPARFKCPAPA